MADQPEYSIQPWVAPPRRPKRKRNWEKIVPLIVGGVVGFIAVGSILTAIFGDNDEKKAAHRAPATTVTVPAPPTVPPSTVPPSPLPDRQQWNYASEALLLTLIRFEPAFSTWEGRCVLGQIEAHYATPQSYIDATERRDPAIMTTLVPNMVTTCPALR
jgi:hypothetical protein